MNIHVFQSLRKDYDPTYLFMLAKYYEKNVMFEDDYKFNMLTPLN